MEGIFNKVKKYLDLAFSTRAAGLYILLFAIAIGVATFIENDFGTSSAQKIIFRAWWFELLLLLFCITLVVNIIRFRMIPQKRWALLTFHTAMIIILIGSAITRYFSYEGVMHIRENETANTFISAETYLQFSVIKNNQRYTFDEHVLFASLGRNKFKESYLVGNDLIELEINEFIPNPQNILEQSLDGKPTIKIVIAGRSGREEYFLSQGESRRIANQTFNFGDKEIPEAVNIRYQNNELSIKANQTLVQTVMATQTTDTLLSSGNYYPLRLRSMYNLGSSGFVFDDFNPQGKAKLVSSDPKVRNESMTALKGKLSVNGQSTETVIYGKKGMPGRPSVHQLDDLSIGISYGAKPIQIPFHIKLYKFVLEKYPGTNSAASYASEVQLIDERKNIKEDSRIYMNHILTHDGYRFFQSSFDQDEKGTYLSVNHDFWGTWVSYIGYILLTIGLVFSFFSKKSRFYTVSQKIKKLRVQRSGMIVLLLGFFFIPMLNGQKVIDQIPAQSAIDASHAAAFSKLIVQDHNGRMKPVHTLTREFLRKLMRKESIYDLTADQVILGMFVNSAQWQDIPMIKLGKHETVYKILDIEEDYASYNDFFNENGSYKIRDEVRRAYGLQPIDRGVLEKELMKIDERVNIASLIYSGRMLRLIPVPGDPNNLWVSTQGTQHGNSEVDNPVAERFFPAYVQSLRKSIEDGNYDLSNKIIAELSNYQQEFGGSILPSKLKARAEIVLNNSNVFGRLSYVYSILGILFLALLFINIFNPSLQLNRIYQVLFGLVIAAFTFHTMGLGLRWYVSGRAPWSNGYESMIYIAWTTTLAGIIFTRKSYGGLAATMILAATVLLVAMLSYLDPEITPLVPVLKSYWLTIHVSLEAGSYGFLMLGAIIGLINLILMIFLTERNKERIKRIVKEMSYISELTLTGGLVMVSVGTYLGGVWANESWGRYWGWDAKETWALVTILVYAFILHMRLIPKLNGLYAFNVATLFGWGSVIMTYYGVNYYLSGLHSYAAGDPIPIPNWVYYAVISLILISLAAFWRKKKIPVIS